jgi:Spherulation-specific family 4
VRTPPDPGIPPHPGTSPAPHTPPAPLRRRLRWAPVVVIVLVVAAAVSLTVKLTSHSARPCQLSFVPAFFPPQDWGGAATGGRAPAVLILNPASGPGAGPDEVFRPAIRRATGAGTRVIGYIGTEYGQRPLAQAEKYVREYRQWYAVTGIFLDQTPTEGTAQIGYYRSLASFIRRVVPGATIWLNPGVYPDRAYMSVGNVVMAFEGSYATYADLRIPSWARQYPARRFAHTVYATPGQAIASAVRLSRQRNAGYLYLTDDVGANPYAALPNYWPHEQSVVAGGCAHR